MEANETSDQSNEVAEDAQELLNATANATDKTVVDARRRLSAALDAAKNAYMRVQKKAVAGAQATDKAIRENPYQAMAIAFGLGALVGILISRRNRD